MVLYGVIMAGGYGTRFWPYSRANKPKQLLKLFSDKSMMQETVERLEPLIPAENIFISTNGHLGDLIKKEVPKVQFVIEPMQRDTAACIGLSAISIMNKDPDGIMFIETADHLYKDIDAYLDTIRKAVITATKNRIALIGIKPTFPHTGLGYIKKGIEFDDNIPNTFIIDEFKEKPDHKTAASFVESGDFLWNSGMFIARCSVMLDEIRKYMPDLHSGLMRIRDSGFDENITKEVFESLEKISIDYGIMEKSDNTVVIESEMPWDDIGDFKALERWFIKDENKNISLGEYEGTANDCILLSQTRKIIANNISGIIIVDTIDATFICKKSDMKNIKKVIQKIKDVDLSNYLDDYVEDYKMNIVSQDSDDCEVKTDGLIVLLGVQNLDIRRDDKILSIQGVEDDV
ncbi:mannose-1-phosphate guanylyltransferase [Candidatus Woesearchaeota archaeon]|nr:mannose-1-phosphate guanylyltransferase [Candidatus Woesearchaeota archaeon]